MMQGALYNLLTSPQNNLKVYSNGNLCFSGMFGGSTESSSTFDEIRNICNGNFTSAGEQDTIEILLRLLVTILLKESLLNNLQCAQKMDAMDIEAIYYLQKKLELNGIPSDCVETSLQDIEKLNKMNDDEIRIAIDQYLTSATAKDCSIMVTLYRLPNTTSPTLTEVNNFSIICLEDSKQYIYRLAVVDIDPKSAENIESYYQIDQEIASLYTKQKKKEKMLYSRKFK